MRKLKEDKKISWTEAYTEKTRFLKDMYHDIIGPKSYYRFEGKEIGGGDEWYVIISPSGVKEHEKKWFAGIRKLPDKWPAGGKKFDSITDAFAYAYDTWGVPKPREIPHYTMTDLKAIGNKEEEWRKSREQEDKKVEAAVSSQLIRIAMPSGTVQKSGIGFHTDEIKNLLGADLLEDIRRNRPELGETKVAYAARVLSGIRRDIMYNAAMFISEIHPNPSEIGLNVPYAISNGGRNPDEVNRNINANINIVKTYYEFLNRYNNNEIKALQDRGNSPIVTSRDIRDKLTLNNVKTSTLHDHGLLIRRMFVDVLQKTSENPPVGLNGEESEAYVLLSQYSGRSKVLAAALAAYPKIERSKTAASAERRVGNNDLATLVSSSSMERSMAWILRESAAEHEKFADRYKESIGRDMPEDYPVPVDMFLEVGRTDGQECTFRMAMIGSYMSGREFENLQYFFFDSDTCKLIAGKTVKKDASQIEALAKAKGYWEKSVSADKSKSFFRECGVRDKMHSSLLMQDVPLTYTQSTGKNVKDGVAYIRAIGGEHLRRILETAGTFYCGTKTARDDDPIDNDLLKTVLLQPEMVKASELMKKLAAAGQSGFRNRIAERLGDSPTGLVSRASILSILGVDAGKKHPIFDPIFYSCSNILTEQTRVSVDLSRGEFYPSVTFTPKGALMAMRYVVGEKWKLKDKNPKAYRDFLIDIIVSHDPQQPRNRYLNTDINELEKEADAVLASDRIPAFGDLKSSASAVKGNEKYGGMVRASVFDECLLRVYGDAVIESLLDKDASIPGADSPEVRNEVLSQAFNNGSGVMVRLKPHVVPGPGRSPKYNTLPEGGILMTKDNKFPFDAVFPVTGGEPSEGANVQQNGPQRSPVSESYFLGSSKSGFFPVTISDVAFYNSFKKGVNKVLAKSGSAFSLSPYNPEAGGSISATEMKTDKMDPTEDKSPMLLDEVVTGNLNYGEFLKAVASGSYGDFPIIYAVDRSGNISFPFASPEKMACQGTREIRTSDEAISHGGEYADTARQIRDILSSMESANQIVHRLVDRVGQKGFWWKGEQPTEKLVRNKLKGRGSEEFVFPLQKFLTLDISRNDELLEILMRGRNFSSRVTGTTGLSASRMASAVESVRSDARKMVASIIMKDIHDGHASSILSAEVMAELGISAREAEDIPGTTGADSVVNGFSEAMEYNPEVGDGRVVEDQDPAIQEEADIQAVDAEETSGADVTEIDAVEEAETPATETPAGEQAVEEPSAPVEETEVPEEPVVQETPRPSVPDRRQEMRNRLGLMDREEEEEDDDFAALSPAAPSTPAPAPTVTQAPAQTPPPAPVPVPPVQVPPSTPAAAPAKPQENVAPSPQQETVPQGAGKATSNKAFLERLKKRRASTGDLRLTVNGGTVVSTNGDGRGIIEESVKRLSTIASVLANEGKDDACMEINQVINKMVRP